jgi:hypothetical protein
MTQNTAQQKNPVVFSGTEHGTAKNSLFLNGTEHGTAEKPGGFVAQSMA